MSRQFSNFMSFNAHIERETRMDFKSKIAVCAVLMASWFGYQNSTLRNIEPVYFTPVYKVESFVDECKYTSCKVIVSSNGKSLEKPYRVYTTKPIILEEGTLLGMPCQLDLLSKEARCASTLIPVTELEDKYYKNKEYDLRLAASTIVYF